MIVGIFYSEQNSLANLNMKLLAIYSNKRLKPNGHKEKWKAISEY
jgi:hypothetical protein